MNETDVREHIVRPFLERLGYKFGTDATIRTEVHLSYPRVFLGRKKPDRDPVIAGRSDYVLDVVGAGKWVVEVKAPNQGLDTEVIQQTHTYAAHPEIAAFYFLITNGNDYKLFQTGSLEAPLLEWNADQQDAVWLNITNVLSPAAIRKRAKIVIADPGDPLVDGLPSRLRIIGGMISYDKQFGTHPIFMGSTVEGIELPVTGGEVIRDEGGQIHARVSIAKVAPLVRNMGAVGLADEYDFLTSDRHISRSAENPTIFQNRQADQIGGSGASSLGNLRMTIPFHLAVSSVTEAVGYVTGESFEGTMTITSELTVLNILPQMRTLLKAQYGVVPDRAVISQVGRFAITVIPNLHLPA